MGLGFVRAQEIAVNSPLMVQGAQVVINEAERRVIEKGSEYMAIWNTNRFVTQDLDAAMMNQQKLNYQGR